MEQTGFSLIVSALWLGILTSISPCPLATNIAALSYISRQMGGKILAAGFLYSTGRMLAYMLLSLLIVSSVLASTTTSFFLQKYMHLILGPLLIVVGIALFGIISIPIPFFRAGTRLKQYLGRSGLVGAFPLGFIFALTFCPVSAALYFGSLLPLAIRAKSPFGLPALYGFGTALPVAAASIALMGGVKAAGRFFNRTAAVEKWVRVASGTAIIMIGVYLCLRDIFGIV